MRSVKKKRIKIGRLLILIFLLIIGFKIYSFVTINNENINNTSVQDEVNVNRKTEEFNLLLLVNNFNKLPNDYTIDLVNFRSFVVASVLIEDLQEMYNAAKKDNIYLEMTSAYRTKEEQQQIFNNKVSEFTKFGSSYNLAVSMAERTVAHSGYSEHETGLAIDFSDTSNYNKKIKLWDWLGLNAHKYGFILRYPSGKEHITGIDNEPWHYRYVGKKDAIIIYRNGLTLEEYLNLGK